MNAFMTRLLLIFFVVCCKFTYGDLPPEIEKCHAGDGDCIAKTLNLILKNYRHGIPEIGLTDIEKLSLNNVVLTKSNPQSAVSLNLEFKKMNLHGISNATVQRMVGFEKDLLHSKFEAYVMIPNLILDGDYISSGKVLLLPMDGTGYAKIELKNTQLSLKLKAEEMHKDGKLYMKVKAMKCKITPESMHVEFGNLFNGNKELGASLNQLINENWKTVWNDMQTQSNDALMRVMGRLLENVLNTLPYEEFYQ